jgi:hypothetical protein
MVPRHIQQAVWAHYRVGQCDDMDVTREWLQAAEAAIGSVAKKEGRHVSPSEAEAMEYFLTTGPLIGAPRNEK